jgi:hypothetical protein
VPCSSFPQFAIIDGHALDDTCLENHHIWIYLIGKYPVLNPHIFHLYMDTWAIFIHFS